jgi:26S proteasome regulatory subunit N11
VDPIQSVKGKVVIDAFRTIQPQSISEFSICHFVLTDALFKSDGSRTAAIYFQCRSHQQAINTGESMRPLCDPLTPYRQALIHGLNRHYYSIGINFRKTELEQAMLLNLHKTNWTEGLKLQNFEEHKHVNEKAIGVRIAFA